MRFLRSSWQPTLPGRRPIGPGAGVALVVACILLTACGGVGAKSGSGTATRAPDVLLVVTSKPGQLMPPTAGPTRTPERYIVREGDTLSSIALAFNVSVEAIAAANGIEQSGMLFIGQELAIP